MEKRNISITLSDHLQSVIQYQLDQGYYANTSEVIGAAMALFEKKALQMEGLRAAIKKGEDSGYISSEEFEKRIQAHKERHLKQAGLDK